MYTNIYNNYTSAITYITHEEMERKKVIGIEI